MVLIGLLISGFQWFQLVLILVVLVVSVVGFLQRERNGLLTGERKRKSVSERERDERYCL